MNADKRTDEELNRIIAEWMGWKFHAESSPRDPEYYMPEHWTDETGMAVNWSFCEDLNAVHEVEKKLTDDQFEYYGPILGDVTRAQSRRALVSAEARQRAEALVTLIEDPLLNK